MAGNVPYVGAVGTKQYTNSPASVTPPGSMNFDELLVIAVYAQAGASGNPSCTAPNSGGSFTALTDQWSTGTTPPGITFLIKDVDTVDVSNSASPGSNKYTVTWTGGTTEFDCLMFTVRNAPTVSQITTDISGGGGNSAQVNSAGRSTNATTSAAVSATTLTMSLLLHIAGANVAMSGRPTSFTAIGPTETGDNTRYSQLAQSSSGSTGSLTGTQSSGKSVAYLLCLGAGSRLSGYPSYIRSIGYTERSAATTTLQTTQAMMSEVPVSGDLLLDLVVFNNGSNGNPSLASGWTSIGVLGDDTTDQNGVAGYKTSAGGATDGTYTLDGTPASSSAVGCIVCLKGGYAYQASSLSKTDSSLTSPSVSANNATDIFVSVLTFTGSGTGFLPVMPTGFDFMKVVQLPSPTQQVGVAIAFKQLSSSGSTGTATWSGTGLTTGISGVSSFIINAPASGSTATMSLGLSLGASSQAPATATASLSLSASAVESAGPATASISLSVAATESVGAITGALALTMSATEVAGPATALLSLALSAAAKTPATATGSLSLALSAVESAGSATCALSLAMSAVESAGTATGALSLALSAVESVGAITPSLSLSMSATEVAGTVTGSLTLSCIAINNTSATGALSISMSASAQAAATATAALALAMAAVESVGAVTGALSLAMAATSVVQSITGALSLAMNAVESVGAIPVSLALSMSATGVAGPATMAISISAAATAQAPDTATGSISLTLSATATPAGGGAGSITLVMTANAGATATATGSLALGLAATELAGVASMALALALGASAAASASASTSLTLSMSATTLAGPATMAITLSGGANVQAAAIATAALALGLSASATGGQNSATGSLALALSAVSQAGASATFALSIVASANAVAQAIGTANLALALAPQVQGSVATGSLGLTLAALTSVQSATCNLSLNGSGAAQGVFSIVGALSLSMTAATKAAVNATIQVALAMSAGTTMPASGAIFLALFMFGFNKSFPFAPVDIMVFASPTASRESFVVVETDVLTINPPDSGTVSSLPILGG